MATIGSAKGVDIVVRSNLKAYKKEWKHLQKHIKPKHIGFALGSTVFQLSKILNKNTQFIFDRPVGATKKAFGYIAPTRQQKTIAEKTAWVGLRSERNLPLTKTKPNARGWTSQAGRRYRKLMRLQVDGGTRTATNGQYFWSISKNSQKAGMLNKSGGLNYKRIKSNEANKKQFFTGIPRGIKRRGNARGQWKRLGKDGRKNLQMVVALEEQTTYRKRYPYSRIIRSNTNRLLKQSFNKEMSNLKRYIKRKKIKKMRNMRAG